MEKTISNQELFDKVVAYSRTMSEQCSDGGVCRYRGPNGNKCLVGSLITDEVYNKYSDATQTYGNILEGESLHGSESVKNAINESLGVSLTPDNIGLLCRMQTIHDYEFKQMGRYFKSLARNYGLEFKE